MGAVGGAKEFGAPPKDAGGGLKRCCGGATAPNIGGGMGGVDSKCEPNADGGCFPT